jgi:hypothetical protein
MVVRRRGFLPCHPTELPGTNGHHHELEFHNWIKYVVPLISPMLNRVGTKVADGLVTALDG